MSETRTKEGRIAISALPIEYADDALIGELMVDRKTGQMAVKTEQGVSSFDANMATGLAENKVLSIMRTNYPKFKGSMYSIEALKQLPVKVDAGSNILSEPVSVLVSDVIGIYIPNFSKVPVTLTLKAKMIPNVDEPVDTEGDDLSEGDDSSIVLNEQSTGDDETEYVSPQEDTPVEDTLIREIKLTNYPYIEELIKISDVFSGSEVEGVTIESIVVEAETVVSSNPILVKAGGVK